MGLGPFGFEVTGRSAIDTIAAQTPQRTWETRSGAEIAALWRAAGYRFGNEDFYDLRRQKLRQVSYEDQIQSHDPTQFVPTAWEATPIGPILPRNRLYRFRIKGYLPGTETETERFLSIATDQRLTIETAEALMMSIASEDPQFYNIQATEVEMVSVLRERRRRS